MGEGSFPINQWCCNNSIIILFKGGIMAFWAAAVPAAMSLASSFMQKDGSGGAEEIGRMREQQKRFLQPYVDAGQRAIPTLEEQYKPLLSDPGSILSKLGAGYQKSPGYQYLLDEATREAGHAASAGGYVGSPQHQEEMARRSAGIASQDYGQYMGDVKDLFSQGLRGEQQLMGTGAATATSSMQSLNDMLKHQADISRQKQQSGLEMLLGAGAAGAGALDLYGKRKGWGEEGKWGSGFFGKEYTDNVKKE